MLKTTGISHGKSGGVQTNNFKKWVGHVPPSYNGSDAHVDESLLRSWVNFGQPSTPAKVHHCSMVSPFVDNGSQCIYMTLKKICGSLESPSLEMA